MLIVFFFILDRRGGPGGDEAVSKRTEGVKTKVGVSV